MIENTLPIDEYYVCCLKDERLVYIEEGPYKTQEAADAVCQALNDKITGGSGKYVVAERTRYVDVVYKG